MTDQGELSPGPQHELQESSDYSQFVSAVPLMVQMARHAVNNEAISHRDFHVGASAYVIKFDGSRLPIVIGGANYKPDEKSPKYCAEMDVIDHAEEDKYDQIIGMVIAGTDEPEAIKSVMGRVTPTLHPCTACQQKMQDSHLVTPDTVIVTMALDSDKAQVHTFDDLQMIYELEEKQGASIMAPAVDLDLANWDQKVSAFDAITQMSADNDPVSVTQLVLSSTVSLEN
jgi:cytidine deaminase